MSHLPPSSPQAMSAFEDSPEDILQQGLAALKQRDYTAAAESLASLSRDKRAPSSVRLKAHIGWIKALKGRGETEKAIALCQKIARHPQPKVQSWAKQMLSTLESARTNTSASTNAQKQPPETLQEKGQELSGFQPITPAPPEEDQAASIPASVEPSAKSSATPDGNLSGFQPLIDAAEEPPTQQSPRDTLRRQQATQSEYIGTDTSDISEPLTHQASSDGIQEPVHPESEISEESFHESHGAKSDSSEDAPPSDVSLFHYERLNQNTQESPHDSSAASTKTVESMDKEPTEASGLTPDSSTADSSTADSSTADSSTAGSTAESVEYLQFAPGERLSRLRPLPKISGNAFQLWVIQGLSAIALFWLCRALVQFGLTQVAKCLQPLTRFVSIPLGWRYEEHTVLTLFCLLGLLLAAPWILEWMLQRTAGLKPLAIQTLKQTHPEGCRLLRQVSQRRDWLLPNLREIPTDLPIMFSYGWLPRYSRIAVSRGLLRRLEDDEFAAMVGYELSHLVNWTLPLMTLVGLLLQLLHLGYWQAALWGDRQPARYAKTLAAFTSALCYGLYWLVRKLMLPFSRVRVVACDRQTVEWTGNPNGYMRALVKSQHGIAEHIARTGYTPPLLESTDLLTPYGVEPAVSLGSLFPQTSFLSALRWDVENPYRRWLSINSSHPRLGERLKQLARYSLRWQLTPALPVADILTPDKQKQRNTFWSHWRSFLQQIGPYIGPVVGVMVAMLLWFLGGLFEPLGLRRVAWIYGDRSVLLGSLMLGLGMGIMIRINAYFPDITSINCLKRPSVGKLLQDSTSLPTDSQPLRLEGQLIGRKGIANWLCQDLILKTSSGLLKLHFLSVLGAFGNLLIHPQHPTDWVSRTIEVQGWYRRGAIAWIDIDTFLKSGKTVSRANHPMWSVFLSLAFCAAGLITLVRG